MNLNESNTGKEIGQMDKELYQISARCAEDVYQDSIDLGGGVQVNIFHRIHYGLGMLKVVAFSGSRMEFFDWSPVHGNLCLWSRGGIKGSAQYQAKKAKNDLPNMWQRPLVVTGHSRGAAAAIAYKRLYGADYCVAFAPPPVIRPWAKHKMMDTTLFIDPDDPVSDAGGVSFDHPDCNIIRAKDDPGFKDVGAHPMSNWLKFVGEMKETK